MEPLELELVMIVSCSVSVGNKAHPLDEQPPFITTEPSFHLNYRVLNGSVTQSDINICRIVHLGLGSNGRQVKSRVDPTEG